MAVIGQKEDYVIAQQVLVSARFHLSCFARCGRGLCVILPR